jgi:hypothetical protein
MIYGTTVEVLTVEVSAIEVSAIEILAIEVLAIVAKLEASQWLAQFASPE